MSLKAWGKAADFDREELAAGYEEDLAGDASFWKPATPGEYEIRVVAPAGQKRPYRARGQHWIRRGNKKQSFNCPKVEVEDANCFLCDLVAELMSGTKEDKEVGKELRAKMQWLYCIIDMEHPRKGVQVYGAPKSVHGDIARLLTDKKDYGPVILDPVEGFGLILTREGTTQNDTEYSVRGRIRPEDVTEYLKDADPPDLAAICEPASNDDMRKGYEGEDEAEAAATDAPRSRRRDVADDEPQRPRDEDKPKARDDEDKPKSRRARNEEPEAPPARPGRRLGSRGRDED